MKILVAAGFSESLIGFRLPLLKTMVTSGHEVHVTGPEDGLNITSVLKNEGIHFHKIPLLRAGLNPWSDYLYRLNLVRLMHEIKPSFFLGYTHKPVIHGLKAAEKSGVQFRVALITGLGYSFTDGSGLRRIISRKALEFLYKCSFPSATSIFFQNPDDAATFRSSGLLKRAPAPKIVSGSGIPLDQFPMIPVPSGPPVFLMLARLLRDKGVREFAKAAEITRKQHPQARFLLGGSLDANPTSVSESELNSWIKAGSIEYLGQVKDIQQVLSQCTAYVLPSYREGTPRSVLEAMSTGRGIITTDAPGCRETIQNAGIASSSGVRIGANGFLVPVAKIEPLVEVMNYICNNPQWAVEAGAKSRFYAELKYDVNIVNQEILSVITEK